MATGDRVFMVVGNKPETANPTTPTGWSLAGTATGGGGTTGARTGPVRITVFYRDKDASWSTMPLVTVTGANVSWAGATVYRSTVGWAVPVSAIGSRSTAATAWAVTLTSNPGLQPGDLAFVASNSSSWQATYSAESITATGVTAWSTFTERYEGGNSGGNEVGGWVFDGQVVTGTSTANPVINTTLSTTTGAYGPSILVRQREAAAVAPGPRAVSRIIQQAVNRAATY
jgi:hypothetical protein